ncbi:hypothetical protein AY600_16670 [Phormidium willei BDU 130791]|nr:hypothetical protein AY600_16670 [Phormidium willei BDU 130791]
MKLKRSTQVLLLLAVIFGGGVLLYEGAIAPELERQRQQEQQAFKFEVEAIRQMTLRREDYTLELTRLEEPLQIPSEDETSFTTTDWQAVIVGEGEAEAQEYPANDAYVSFLLMVLDNARSDRPIVTSEASLAEYGLETPRARLRIELDNGESQELWVGDRDFTGSFVYGLIRAGDDNQEIDSEVVPEPDSQPDSQPDSEANDGNNTAETSETSETGEVSVFLLPLNLENAVNRSPEDWQAQPLPAPPQVDEPETETPETETPEIETPELETPEIETPETETSETETSETETPEVETPETDSEDGENGDYRNPPS